MYNIIYLIIGDILGREYIFWGVWDTWISVLQKVLWEVFFLKFLSVWKVCVCEGGGGMKVGIVIVLLSLSDGEGGMMAAREMGAGMESKAEK